MNIPDPGKVLVIDDEQSLRDGAKRILSRMNFSVFLASRGDEGLAILENEPVGIVLLDLKMPGMSGMEVLKKIMDMERGIIVIVITGYSTVETAIEAMKMGAYDFIPKPYKPDQLRLIASRGKETLELKLEAENLAKQQKRTLADLHTEKSRIYTIIESSPNGLLVTDTRGVVVLINPASYQHLNIDPAIGPGKTVDQYIADNDLVTLVMDISKGRYIDYNDIPSHELDINNEKIFLIRCRPVLGERHDCLGAVVNIVDISAMKALDNLKAEFMAKVSHELRSPLSTIHEQLAMVVKGLSQNLGEDDQYMLARAKEKTLGLISTVGDLLDLSRIEAEISAKELKPIQINELLKNIVDFLRIKAETKKQKLFLEIPDKPMPSMEADLTTMESVFGNLITNAINYTQEGGEIKVATEVTGNNIRVKVKDNGFGIEPKHMEKIFNRFYRVKNDKTRFITGTGLGLPIVKGIVDSIGGYIDVKSEVNKGTTFTVILPLKKPSIASGIM
ncbi:MAG: response regulator [Thermodesulfobacteriota bacterium]|nr:response regulator [Thermodesulfobacteriota bacterium]